MTVHRSEAEHLLPLQATLGEGPVWDRHRGVLWFVDIAASRVYRLSPDTGQLEDWPAPSKACWLAPDHQDDMVVGLADGLYRFSPADGSFTLLRAVEADRADTRVNDGTRDPGGRYWFGTLCGSAEVEGGRFYHYDGTTVTDAGLPPVQITNGPAVSLDGRTLYAVDTLGGTIHAHTIGADGRLTDPRPFATIAVADGYPDGVTCDAEGGVWVGLWNGWCARRYDAAGDLTDEVRFPVANITKVALGGADGRTAFATTAREGQSGDTSGHQPLGGDLFRFAVRVPGFFDAGDGA
jgi:sugar lactone lactonase YvrE